jgi:Flp pilus assembly protein TadG
MSGRKRFIFGLWRQVRGLMTDRSGGAMMLMGLALPAMLGMVAAGVDVGTWYQFRREMQTSVDAGAIAAGYEVAKASTTAVRNAAALTEATSNGYVNTAPASLAIASPPTTGGYVGNTSAVEVNLSAPKDLYLASIILNQDVTINTRSVALVTSDGEACVLALNSSASQAVQFTGNNTSNFITCWVAANSTANNAIDFAGSAVVAVDGLWTPGYYSMTGNNAQLNDTYAPRTRSFPLADPYANLTISPSVAGIPSLGGCNQTSFSVAAHATVTMSPGVYCSGIDLRGTAHLTPGTYYVDRGDFTANSGAVVDCPTCTDGAGVTIVMTRTTSTVSQIGQISINGGSTVTLTAPNSGVYDGLVFYQDRRANSCVNGTCNVMNGGATMNISGAIYAPKQKVDFAGNNGVSSSNCVRIISDTVVFTGSSTVHHSGCDSEMNGAVDVVTVKIVE